MSDTTKIEWCDSTFNPWIGCTKVGPGCDHCYAEVSTPARAMGIVWGPHAERKRTSAGNWALPLRWERQHADFFAQHGRRRRVFCASLADVFDNQVPAEWRADLFRLIEATPNLDWLLVTKRIGNVLQMVMKANTDRFLANEGFNHGLPGNVWLGITVVNQDEADRDIPKLLAVPARVRFLSMEPLLGPVDLSLWLDIYQFEDGGQWSRRNVGQLGDILDWVIVGGESGHHARPMSPDWVRSLRDQCAAARVPLLFKQWGEWGDPDSIESTGLARSGWFEQSSDDGGVPRKEWPGPAIRGVELASLRPEVFKVGKKAAGRLLDGVEHNDFPGGYSS